jgi:hypothetical protein
MLVVGWLLLTDNHTHLSANSLALIFRYNPGCIRGFQMGDAVHIGVTVQNPSLVELEPSICVDQTRRLVVLIRDEVLE